jgi:hypothetical protein
MAPASVLLLSVDIVVQAKVFDDFKIRSGIVLLEVEHSAAEAVADDAAEFGWVQTAVAFQGA